MGERLALGTRWAGTPPSPDRVRKLLELEPDGLAIHPEVRRRDLEAMQGFLPSRSVACLPLFAPLPQDATEGAPYPFRMGSLHADTRRDTLKQGLEAIELADRLEAPWVVAPPVELEVPDAAGVIPLLASGAPSRKWELLREARVPAVRPQLDSLLSTLNRLLDQADRYRRRIALTLGGFPFEMPDVAEAHRCLAEFRGAPLFLWVDLLREARYRATGGAGAEDLRGDLLASVGGFTVHDGDRRRGHLPLGAGEVDLASWEELKRPQAIERVWAIDLEAGIPEEALAATREAVRRFLHGNEPEPFEPFRFGKR